MRFTDRLSIFWAPKFITRLQPVNVIVRPKLSTGAVPPTKLYWATPMPGSAKPGVSPQMW